MFSCVTEGQRLYLSAWDFNSCRVLGSLAEIVRNNGGKVKPAPTIMANNRTYEPDAEPVPIYGHGYISFTLDGDYYYFQVDSNPFFDPMILKARIDNGKYREVYLEAFSREWIYDCMFQIANDAEIREIAEILFSLLIKRKCCAPVPPEKHKVKVENLYDNGWHWEYKSESVKYRKVEV
jgi:hypothetical protein